MDNGISSWFPGMRSKSSERLRLFCLPYAGGSASVYWSWMECFPGTIDIRADFSLFKSYCSRFHPFIHKAA